MKNLRIRFALTRLCGLVATVLLVGGASQCPPPQAPCEIGYSRVDGTCAPTWVHKAYIKASNTGRNAYFGRSIALSLNGSRLAVGASSQELASGAVYVFVRGETGWEQEAYLKAPNAETGDIFGSSIAFSADGNRLAVGATGESSNETGVDGTGADNSAPDSGAVYVFVRDGSSWEQEAYLKASNTDEDDGFGWSVALSFDGSRLAVGALSEDSIETGVGGTGADNDSIGTGAVYVFVRDETGWEQEAYVKASNTGYADSFGHSVALSTDGSRLAVGVPSEDSDETGVGGTGMNNNAPSSGAVYVFVRDETGWEQQAYLKASNAASGDRFGNSVSLSLDGSRLAVGAMDEDSGETGVDGTGADDSAPRSGAAYVFVWDGSGWEEEAYLKASNTGAGDAFGVSLALSYNASRLVVGARTEDSGETGVDGTGADDSAQSSGAVYVFVRRGNSWAQEAYLKSSNTGEFDAFGSKVALSMDGRSLAVGAPYEDSSDTGIGGSGANNNSSGSGAAYVYQARR